MAKSAELLSMTLAGYRREPSGQMFFKNEKGVDFLVECDRCGNTTDWLVPPGPKEAITLICNSCVTTYVYAFSPQT